MSFPLRALRRFLPAVLLLSTLIVAVSPATSDAAVISPGASPAHPYSRPVWWPLSVETKMDCYSGNPGCTSPRQHSGWLMDVVSTNMSVYGRTAHEPVFAMGAGIVHWGVTRDQGCGGVHGRGNFLYIDHGNGVLSYYGHLAWPFSVPNGAYVTARTKIAEIGNSGYSNCKKFPNLHYIDIAVKYGGTNGQYVQVTSSYACVNGVRRVWPQQLPANRSGAWHRWNDIPASHNPPISLIAGSDASRSCIDPTPRTANRATGITLRGYGAANLRATWALPAVSARATSTKVELQEYHPAIRQWLDARIHPVSPRSRATVFTHLQRGRAYRVGVDFYNSTGWSAMSSWSYAKSP